MYSFQLGCDYKFMATMRMSPDIYHELKRLVYPIIYIIYSVHTLHHAYLLGYSTVLPIVRDTCRAIFRVLKDEHMKVIFMFNVLVNSVNYFFKY